MAFWLGCLLSNLAWKLDGVSMVCCLDKAGCWLATLACRNHGNEIFRFAFWVFVKPLPEPDILPFFSRDFRLISRHICGNKQFTTIAASDLSSKMIFQLSCITLNAVFPLPGGWLIRVLTITGYSLSLDYKKHQNGFSLKALWSQSGFTFINSCWCTLYYTS